MFEFLMVMAEFLKFTNSLDHIDIFDSFLFRKNFSMGASWFIQRNGYYNVMVLNVCAFSVISLKFIYHILSHTQSISSCNWV